MHLQLPPHEEAKLVRCTMGAIYDVVLDLKDLALGPAPEGRGIEDDPVVAIAPPFLSLDEPERIVHEPAMGSPSRIDRGCSGR